MRCIYWAMNDKRLRWHAVGDGLVCLLLLVSLLASAFAQDPPPNAKWKLTKIEFQGLQTQNRDKIIAASGLQIGETIDFEAVKAAAKRLSEAGVFSKVAFRYRYSSTQIELTFEVEEAKTSKYICVFDNFIWFTEQELNAAIKRDVPDFDGTAMDSDFVIGEIKKSLTRFLREQKIAGEIVSELNQNDVFGRSEHIFKVKDANLKVCAAQFPGANDELQKALLKVAGERLNTDYSKSESDLFAYAAFLPVYQQRGYLKARVQPSKARLGDGGCTKGVVILWPVEEGAQYRWEKVIWSGNTSFPAQELDEALRLKHGDVADILKINGSWADVGGIYGKKGYVKAHVRPEPVFDDTRQLVSYKASITEGPQYRMGQVAVAGLPETDAKRIKDAWQLKSGEIFDNNYAGNFLAKLTRDGLITPAMGIKRLGYDRKVDDQKLTVDITIKLEH